MARLELEVGTDVLLLETGDALLLEGLLQAVGDGAVAIAGALNRKTAKIIGAGSISIAGTLGRNIKRVVGSAAVTIAGSLGRKIALSVGSGSATIAGTLASIYRQFVNVGSGTVGIASILGHFFFIDIQSGAIVHFGSIPTPIMLIEDVTKGDALGYDNGWKRALATAGSVVQFRCVATEDGRKNQTITAYFGTVLLSGRLSGGVAGRALYVEEGTGSGRYTLTKPTTAGDADTVVGYMLTGSLALIHSSLNDDSTV